MRSRIVRTFPDSSFRGGTFGGGGGGGVPKMFVKKHFRLTLHRPPQIVIKIRKDVVNRILSLEIPQVEPLAGEIRSENACAFVGKHAPDLGLQNSRVFQSSLECDLE